MTSAIPLHAVRITAPFYQASSPAGSACGLHRYLDPDFINRFRQELQRRQFDAAPFSRWQEDERHSRHGREPVLRLPLHRAFHLVCCEVVCDRPGQPALDPQKISGAGFVIRKLGAEREQAWMLEDGEALGWHGAAADTRDPDLHRRLCASGVLHPRADQPAYSGEEVHPLHTLKTTDAAGKTHTLLYGYLPLGGFYYHRNPVAALDADSVQAVQTAAAAALPWPFGYRAPGAARWQDSHGRPLQDGRPNLALFELLRLLVHRYHLGEAGQAANEPLERLCAGLWLHDLSRLPPAQRQTPFTDASQALFAPCRTQSFGSYLQACFARGDANPLVRWLIVQEQRADRSGGLAQLPAFDPLPASTGDGHLSATLLLQEADAQELRNLLGQRLHTQTLNQVREIPLPKFSQGRADCYQIVPFVRVRDAEGRERIQWAASAARSLPFRVAAPFDPEASRPVLIQMPSLSDLRRGLARGAAMITPADTFNLINALKLNKGASADAVPEEAPGGGPGLQWICSFSLPVITLVAMILLMIMISLLNILFFWLPWVRICLPFPKVK